MDPTAVPRVQIGASEASIPVIGLGTWKSPGDEVKVAVSCAIEAGYRHFDCAFGYGNESAVGAALSEKISQGGVKRENVFVTSKLWNTFHSAEDVKPALQKSLDNLGLDYFDLFMIHWPYGFQRGGEAFPKDKDGNVLYADTHYLETWKAMETCMDEGLVKNLAVSNFNSVQIQDIIDNCRIKPAVVQVEIHPYLSQEKLVKFCKEKDIPVTAYSPLGSGCTLGPGCPSLLGEPILKTLAAKYGKSPAQIVLRWLLQRDIIVIPKSVTPSRIKENIQIFDFQLTAEDMETVHGLNRNHRFGGPYVIKEDGTETFRDKAAPFFPFSADVEF
ncbi:Aldo-keto reductase family 1 member A1 [Lamellibrachia satsuma]|nr:Aldo-keto reductase family 1 member A1 [Lamellibrachia satsuma]